MKNISLLFLFLYLPNFAGAQPAKHKINPKAKKLEDSAIHVFSKCGNTPDCNAKINKLLDAAIKIAPQWYEAWANLLAFQGKNDEYQKCLVTAKKMVALFPGVPDALNSCGIIEYKTNHPDDAHKTFEKLLKLYESIMAKDPKNPNYKDLLAQKGIVLILLDKGTEGKAILRKLYTDETEPYKKSYMAFYVNKTKEEIIEDRIPGK